MKDGSREIAFDGDESWLCRHDQSATKPFYDGSHNKAGFKDNLDKNPVVGQFEFSYVSTCKFHNGFYGTWIRLKDVHY